MESMVKGGLFERGRGGRNFILCVDGLQRGWVLVFVLVLVLVLDLSLSLRRMNGRDRELAFRNAPVGRGTESTRKETNGGEEKNRK
jgi:hypothetical protein